MVTPGLVQCDAFILREQEERNKPAMQRGQKGNLFFSLATPLGGEIEKK